MYFVARGEVEAVDEDRFLGRLGPGDFFGELSLLLSAPRAASVHAKTQCDLYVLEKPDFLRVLRDHPTFATSILEASRERYRLALDAEQCFDDVLARFVGGER
jgi:CRP-like cAMP-binding protein